MHTPKIQRGIDYETTKLNAVCRESIILLYVVLCNIDACDGNAYVEIDWPRLKVEKTHNS